jgi:hypothetical protein
VNLKNHLYFLITGFFVGFFFFIIIYVNELGFIRFINQIYERISYRVGHEVPSNFLSFLNADINNLYTLLPSFSIKVLILNFILSFIIFLDYFRSKKYLKPYFLIPLFCCLAPFLSYHLLIKNAVLIHYWLTSYVIIYLSISSLILLKYLRQRKSILLYLLYVIYSFSLILNSHHFIKFIATDSSTYSQQILLKNILNKYPNHHIFYSKNYFSFPMYGYPYDSLIFERSIINVTFKTYPPPINGVKNIFLFDFEKFNCKKLISVEKVNLHLIGFCESPVL